MQQKKLKSLKRTQARQLASMATRGEAQIREEQRIAHEKEKEAFYNLPLKKRLKYFYDNNLSNKGKRVFWMTFPFVLVFFVSHFVIQKLRLDIAWRWGSMIYHAVFKK